MIRLTALLALLLVLTGCEQIVGTPRAVGEIPQILVVADSATWNGPVGEAVRAELAQPIQTLPNQQGAFKLRHRALTNRSLDGIQTARNVVFVAPIDEQSTVGEFIRARIDAASQEAIRQGQAVGINLRPDLYARGQLVVLATAADAEALTAAILQRGEELRDAFNALALEATEQSMFDRGRQVEDEAALIAAKGWGINLQHDYIQVQDTTVTAADLTGDFVRYRRVLTETWRDFFVFVADGVDEVPPPATLDAMTNDLLETFARGVLDSSYVQLDPRRPVRQDTVEIAGAEALETRGIWRMTADLMAGPYIRFAFVDPETDRLFVYYGMVFAPDRTLDKREFLRHMEVIGRTLRPDASSSPS